MEEKKKKRVNRLQNITIIALSCLALFLFFYSFAPTTGMERLDLAAFFSSASNIPDEPIASRARADALNSTGSVMSWKSATVA